MAIGTTAAILAGLAASAGGSLAKGVMDNRAAKKAGELQSNAAGQVVDLVDQGLPGLQAGVQNAVTQGQAGVNEAASTAATDVGNATGAAATGVEQAAQTAQQGMAGATEQGNQVLRQVYDEATGTMQPYVQLGNRAVTKLGDLADGPDFQFSEDDPSYQWRLQQGQQAIERSAAARGGLNSGGAMKALLRYGQGAASTEYQAAFDRFQQNRGQKFSMLSGLAGLGKSAGDSIIGAGQNFGNQTNRNLVGAAEYNGSIGMQGADRAGAFRVGGAQYGGNARMNAAEYGGSIGMQGATTLGQLGMRGMEIKGNALTDKAAAQAGGVIGGANAWGGALTGIGNAAMTGVMMGQLGRTPTITTPRQRWQAGLAERGV